MCKFSAQHLKACKRKVWKTAHFLYSKFTKRHNSFKNWRKVTTHDLALYYIKTKSCAKFKLNMSEHAGENCGRLCISYILSSKRGITPSKIDVKGWHSNLLCSTSKQSHVQISAEYVKACRRNVWKTVYFQYCKFTRRHNSFKKLTQIVNTRTCSVVHLNKVMCKISAQYVRTCRRKLRKTAHFL